MTETWVIAAHYFHRISRKPLLILFLLAIPFSLLLAEFEAFGRVKPAEQIGHLSLSLQRNASAAFPDQFSHCIRQQSDGSIDVIPVDSATAQPQNADLVVVSSPVSATLNAEHTSSANLLLEASVIKMCSAEASGLQAPIASFAMQREAAKNVSGTAAGGNFFAVFFPGLALFGALFLSQAMAALVWRDQERTVQQRLRCMPVHPSALVFGPILFIAIGSAMALLLILCVCALGINPGALESPVLWAVAAGFGLFAGGLQLVIGLLLKSRRAAQAVSASTNMMLAFFGGGFVPLTLYPPFLRVVAYGLPNGAGQACLTQALEGVGSASLVAGHVAVVWVWAIVLFLGALILQNRQVRT